MCHWFYTVALEQVYHLKQAAELGICKLNIMTDLLIASKENVKPSDKFWEISIRSGIQKPS